MVRAQARKWAWVAHQSRRPPSDCAHTNRRTQQHVRARARTQPNQRRALSFGGAPRARRTQRSRPFLRKRPPPGPLGSAKALGLRFARGHFARPLRATTCVRTATPSLLSLKFLPRTSLGLVSRAVAGAAMWRRPDPVVDGDGAPPAPTFPSRCLADGSWYACSGRAHLALQSRREERQTQRDL